MEKSLLVPHIIMRSVTLFIFILSSTISLAQDYEFQGGFWEAGGKAIDINLTLNEDYSYKMIMYHRDSGIVYFNEKGSWTLGKNESLLLSNSQPYLKSSPQLTKHYGIRLKFTRYWKERLKSEKTYFKGLYYEALN